jgi:UDP-glucose 4-epimerase
MAEGAAAAAETILVPGGAGYIGSHTVRELVRNGFQVVVVDSLINGKAKAVDPSATLETVDLADKDALSAVFSKHKPVAVIDFVAFLAVGESQADPNMYMQNNVVNFVNLLDCMVEAGCKYVIKSSTSSSYGDPPDAAEIPLKEDYQTRYKPTESALGSGVANFPGGEGAKLEGEAFFQAFLAYYHTLFAARPELALDEATQTKLRIPMSIYGLTKLIDEVLMAKYEAAAGLKWMALRYFNVCGAAEEGDIGEDKARPSTLMTMCIYHLCVVLVLFFVFGAVLCCAVLCCAVLCCAVLCCACLLRGVFWFRRWCQGRVVTTALQSLKAGTDIYRGRSCVCAGGRHVCTCVVAPAAWGSGRR